MILNIPIALTWVRIALIPLFVVVFYLPDADAWAWSRPASAIIFAAAAITDWLDGYLARRWDQTSRFGAFLDPVADKLMVAVALVLIVQAHPRVFVALAAAVIIGREITISALREWMAEIGERGKVAVSSIGKFKTIIQMVGLSFMLYLRDIWGLPIYDLGVLLLVVSAGLTLWSMFVYLRGALPIMLGRPGSS